MLAETIVRESRGSPYFVYELVEYLKEGGELGEGSAIVEPFQPGQRARPADRQASRGRVRQAARSPGPGGTAAASSDRLQGRGSGRIGFCRTGRFAAQHLVRGTGLGSLDEVETYHDRIRETVVNMLTRPTAGANCTGGWPWSWRQAGGADPETLGVHFEGAGELAKAGHYYALWRPTRRARRWPLIGPSSSIASALDLGSGDAAGRGGGACPAG